MAIRHRRNSLFYRSERGAEIGDMFMSLIHTAELRGEKTLDFLTAVLRHEKAVAQAPADWLPWTYRASRAAVNNTHSPERLQHGPSAGRQNATNDGEPRWPLPLHAAPRLSLPWRPPSLTHACRKDTTVVANTREPWRVHVRPELTGAGGWLASWAVGSGAAWSALGSVGSACGALRVRLAGFG